MLTEKFQIKELTIVLVAKSHNPSILNPDFLRYNHIVPDNWNVKQKPICIEPMAQVVFENGIQITAELDKVIFLELTKDGKDIDGVKIPEIAISYINVLPHVNYTAVGINPRGHLAFETADDAENFIMATFANIDPWKKFDNKPSNVGFKFSYKLGKSLLTITIETSMFKTSEEKQVPVVLFAANFHHAVAGQTKDEKVGDLSAIINDWRSDIDTYIEFLEKLITG